MQVDIITLFPEMFVGSFTHSILKRAQEKKILTINLHQLRDFATDKRHSVDDKPSGGGPGMIMRVDVIDKALSTIRQQTSPTLGHVSKIHTVLLSPDGQLFNQKIAADFTNYDQLILICGRYEGVDERVKTHLADKVLSIGDYVLSGGELAAMVVVDTVARLLDGVLGNAGSTQTESFSLAQDGQMLLEYPQYTQPNSYQGLEIPQVLLSGNHQKIQEWRLSQALEKTKTIRPDLLTK